MKPEIGKSYECIQDVPGYYVKGQIYVSETDSAITDDTGDDEHLWGDTEVDETGKPFTYFFSTTFKEVVEKIKPEESTVIINDSLMLLNYSAGSPAVNFQGKNENSSFTNNVLSDVVTNSPETFKLDVIDGVVTLNIQGYAIVPKSFLNEEQLKAFNI